MPACQWPLDKHMYLSTILSAGLGNELRITLVNVIFRAGTPSVYLRLSALCSSRLLWASSEKKWPVLASSAQAHCIQEDCCLGTA